MTHAKSFDDLRAALIELTPSQQVAIEALVAGATHAEAATAAGVARESVSRWSGHHPGFQATLHMYRAALADEQADLARRIRGKALAAIDQQLDDASFADSLAVIRAIPATDSGLIDADGIICSQTRITRETQLPPPPLSMNESLAILGGTSDRESDDERAERTTIIRLADASGVAGHCEGQG
jgi:hypothetical protein